MDIRGDYPTSAFPCIGLGSGAGAFVQSGTLFSYLEKNGLDGPAAACCYVRDSNFVP